MTAVALVACSAAGAEPGAPPAPPPGPLPAGWTQLPSIATAVAGAVNTEGVVVDSAAAFGEPARGCYAVRLALHGAAAAAPALADQVLAGFAAASNPRAAFTITDVVKPSEADGVLAFAFDRPPYHGRVRAQLGHGRIAAVACFANQREPLACDAACTMLLQDKPGGREVAP